jgi:hypothetical protein
LQPYVAELPTAVCVSANSEVGRRAQVAIGNCYEHDHLKCYDAAAKCYRRAVTSGDHETIVLHQLARLYQRMDQADAAFSCFKQNLERMGQQGQTGQVRGGGGLCARACMLESWRRVTDRSPPLRAAAGGAAASRILYHNQVRSVCAPCVATHGAR